MVAEGVSTEGGVAKRGVVAALVVFECTIAVGGVVYGDGGAKRRIQIFRGIASGVASVRRRIDRLRVWQKRNAAKRKEDETQRSCFLIRSRWIHGSFFRFPLH